MNSLYPLLMVIAANTFYNISAKSMPENVDPFAGLTVTYFFAMITSIIFYYLIGSGGNVFVEFQKVNWTSYLLGFSIVFLEFGYILVYRAGWAINIASLIANIGLALVLVFVGFLLYQENISGYQLIGVFLCVIGILFLSK